MDHSNVDIAQYADRTTQENIASPAIQGAPTFTYMSLIADTAADEMFGRLLHFESDFSARARVGELHGVGRKERVLDS